MLRLFMQMKKNTFTNAGNVTRKENFMYMKIILLMTIVILTNSCTSMNSKSCFHPNCAEPTKGYNPANTLVRLIFNYAN